MKQGETWMVNKASRSYYEITRSKSEGSDTAGGFGAKLDKMKTIFTTAEGIQKGLDFAASIGEKFGHIGQWKSPFVSGLCTVIMLVASLALWFVSVRLIIIAWGMNKFRKFYFRPNLVDNNELVDLLSRVPSFPEIEQYRQINPRNNRRRRKVSSGGTDE